MKAMLTSFPKVSRGTRPLCHRRSRLGSLARRREILKAGFRVVLAGPPNAGKSTLFNALVESEAAITSPLAGTTRDVIERSVAIEGVPFAFVDTAGLREDCAPAADSIEAEGIERARSQFHRADVVLWLGEEGAGPPGCWEIAARMDSDDFIAKRSARHTVSALTGERLFDLKRDLVGFARDKLPKAGEAALSDRQHDLLGRAVAALRNAQSLGDGLLVAEELRRARLAFDAMVGRAATEDMLDALFGRFCIGK